jgi:hypothetical protein
MAYLTPFSLTLSPGDQLPYRILHLTDEPGIPDDAYLLEEWYCPNPDCSCNEAHLKVFARQQKLSALDLHLSLDLNQPVTPLQENVEDDFPVYARKLFRLLSTYIQTHPEYVQALRQHFLQLRSVAADTGHPNHKAVDYWGKNARHLPASASTRKRHHH